MQKIIFALILVVSFMFANLAAAQSPQWIQNLPAAKNASQMLVVAAVGRTTAWVSMHEKDADGNITAVHCDYIPNTKTGEADCNRKVKSTINWVEANTCVNAEVRLYDRLWTCENPRDEMARIREEKQCDALTAMKEMINPDSLKVLTNCYVEKYLANAKPLDYLQFQRIGYFNVDKDSTSQHLIFNKTVGLKDSWAKEAKK